jgi:hypothetical protein
MHYKHADIHYVYSLWNGNDRTAMVEYWQYFMEFHIAEHLECAQKSKDDCILDMCECGTLVTVAWKS